MTPRTQRLETALLAATVALLLLAVFGPFVAQPADHHHFADKRVLLGIPHAMDVLSNLPFALWAVLGAWALIRLPRDALNAAQWGCAALFFAGLVATTAGSSWYHLQPDDAGLVIDRLGMVLAFAGLLGLAVAGRISARAGVLTALAFMLAGPASVWVWAQSGNVLPWVVAQGGAMLLVLALAALPLLPGALKIRLGLLIACYAVAKLFEMADHQVYEWSGHLLSGHSIKHIAASFAAWPVLSALREALHMATNKALSARQNAQGVGLAKRPVPIRARQRT